MPKCTQKARGHGVFEKPARICARFTSGALEHTHTHTTQLVDVERWPSGPRCHGELLQSDRRNAMGNYNGSDAVNGLEGLDYYRAQEND